MHSLRSSKSIWKPEYYLHWQREFPELEHVGARHYSPAPGIIGKRVATAIHHRHTLAATGYSDGITHVASLESEPQTYSCTSHSGAVTGVRLHARHLTTAGTDGIIAIWDLTQFPNSTARSPFTAKKQRRLQGLTREGTSVRCISALDHSQLAAAYSDRQMLLWDTRQPKAVSIPTASDELVNEIQLVGNLLFRAIPCQLEAYDLRSLSCTYTSIRPGLTTFHFAGDRIFIAQASDQQGVIRSKVSQITLGQAQVDSDS